MLRCAAENLTHSYCVVLRCIRSQLHILLSICLLLVVDRQVITWIMT